jgi:hypothetical protein
LGKGAASNGLNMEGAAMEPNRPKLPCFKNFLLAFFMIGNLIQVKKVSVKTNQLV